MHWWILILIEIAEWKEQEWISFIIKTPVSGLNTSLTVNAIVHYQTVTNKWLEDMFTHSSDEIDTFKEFYDAADKEPGCGQGNIFSKHCHINRK
ncbi:MAG: hypothetical protein R2764_15070 [Bacteroidales bacterium]